MIIKIGNYTFQVESITHTLEVERESDDSFTAVYLSGVQPVYLKGSEREAFRIQFANLVTLEQVLAANQQLQTQLQTAAQQVGQLKMQLEAEAGKRLIRLPGN